MSDLTDVIYLCDRSVRGFAHLPHEYFARAIQTPAATFINFGVRSIVDEDNQPVPTQECWVLAWCPGETS